MDPSRNEPSPVKDSAPASPLDTRTKSLRARSVLQSLRSRRTRLLLGFAVLFVLFTAVASLQQLLVHWEFTRTTDATLRSWAEEMSAQIGFGNGWDLGEFRRTAAVASSSYVIANDGLIIDVEGFFPGVVGPVVAPESLRFASPQDLVASTGETWRVLGKKLGDGYAVLAISPDESVADPDSLLVRNAERLGNTVDEATTVAKKRIDGALDSIIVRSNGELAYAWGGVPLKTTAIAAPVQSGHFESGQST